VELLVAVLGDGVVDSDTPVVRADDLGVLRGDGCFEGCRVRTGADGTSTVDKLDAHLARMGRSAAALGIAFAPADWRELVGEACAAWSGAAPGEAGMKLVLTRGPLGTGSATGFLAITPLPGDYPRQRREGLRVVTLCRGVSADAFAPAPWLLGGVKTLSYAVNMAAQREADRRGADDALFVSAEGIVLEAPTGSVVWSRGRGGGKNTARRHGVVTGPHHPQK
jgi:4-amino-4-deoxychorismate lyase